MEITSTEAKEFETLRKKEQVYLYAYEFWNELCSKEFHDSTMNILPLYVESADAFEMMRSNKKSAVMETRQLENGKEIVNIIIRMNEISKIDDLKEAIRHELIHFALFVNDLKCSDYDAVFKILCERYKANFYKNISGIEKEIYEVSKQYLEKGFELIDKSMDDVVNCSISKMIMIIGDKNYLDKRLIGEMVSKLEKILYDTKVYIEVMAEQKSYDN